MRGLLGAMGWGKRAFNDPLDDRYFTPGMYASPSATGIAIDQQTALSASVVLACVSVISEDVSKMTPQIFRHIDVNGHENGGREIAKDHFLFRLLHKPNAWQTWPEFCRQMVVSYLLRGNAYAAIIRDWRGTPQYLVPINPDRVTLWEAPSGDLFYMITRSGYHELAVLQSLPFLAPFDDMFHLKDLSSNGLIGTSRIALAREAIALALGQEQQYARLMGSGARPSGVLTTDRPMTDAAMKRLKQNWYDMNAGMLNSGKTAVLEQGVKFEPITLTSVDMEFLAQRQFQVGEICRLFRVPPHMVGDLSRGTFNNITQQSQDYRNNTLMSHVDIWEKRFDFQFDLDQDGLFVDFNEGALLKADLTARYNAYRIGILSGFLTCNEVRIAEDLPPVDGGDELMQPTNMAPLGSDLNGNAPDGAGKGKDDVTGDQAPGD